MPGYPTSEGVIPLLPCKCFDETLDFYRVLGFEVPFEQRSPYNYAEVRRGGITLHFSDFKGASQKPAFSTCLVMIPELAPYHRAFSAALRRRYGKVPTAGHPRLSRMRPGLGRFGLFDPDGNWLVFLKPAGEEAGDWEYAEGSVPPSPMHTALSMAALFRDYKGNDDAVAARILDVALNRHPEAPPLERALVMAARAELAVALDDPERARSLRAEMASLPLSESELEHLRPELETIETTERWREGA